MELRTLSLKSFIVLVGFSFAPDVLGTFSIPSQKGFWADGSSRKRSSSPSRLLKILRRAEQAYGIPKHLLRAIALSESGRFQNGQTNPWPWTINVEGKGYFFSSKNAAIQKVRWFQARGVRSIDVGPMQINLLHHPNAFRSLEEAFDPVKNIHYAAEFLSQLSQAQDGGWRVAVAHYHSMNPSHHLPYRRKVLGVWENVKRQTIKESFPGRPHSATPRVQYAHLKSNHSIELLPPSPSVSHNDSGDGGGLRRTPSLRYFKAWKAVSAKGTKPLGRLVGSQKIKNSVMAPLKKKSSRPAQVQRIGSLRTAYWATIQNIRPRMARVTNS